MKGATSDTLSRLQMKRWKQIIADRSRIGKAVAKARREHRSIKEAINRAK